MNNLENLIFEEAKKAIQNIDPKELEDIYTYSFYVSDYDEDPRLPSLTIGYNTITNLKENEGRSDSKAELKWNFAFWLQNELVIIGEDEESQKIITEWLKNEDLYYTDEDEEEENDLYFDNLEIITPSYVKILISVVQRLHAENITQLPIIIHELEYYDEIRDQTVLANGLERVSEFAKWIDDMYK